MTTSGDFVAANSRKVRGYVKAVLAHRKAQAKRAKLAPKWAKVETNVERTRDQVTLRFAKLSGGQRAAAERILASPAVECLAKPCKVEGEA